MAYDRPVVGHGAKCINTLRLWAAAAPESFDFAEFSHDDFAGAVIDIVAAESVTRVLYPTTRPRPAGRCASAAVFSRELLAPGYRGPIHAPDLGLVDVAGPRRRADERHAPRALGRGADADSPRSGGPRVG